MKQRGAELCLNAKRLIAEIRKQTEAGLLIIKEAKEHLKQHARPRPIASNDP